MMLHTRELVARYLNQILKERKTKNRSYSLRAFARALQTSPASLSEILRGKRDLSAARALRLLEKAGVAAEKIQRVRRAYDPAYELLPLKKIHESLAEKVLQVEDSSLMNDWLYFAITALVRTKNFEDDPSELAKRFSVSVTRVRAALKKLYRLGIISKDPKTGRPVNNRILYRGDDSWDDRRRQRDGLKIALRAISRKDPSQLGTYATISVNPRHLTEAAKLMEAFVKKMGMFLSQGEPVEKENVFELAIQLFPLSQSASD